MRVHQQLLLCIFRLLLICIGYQSFAQDRLVGYDLLTVRSGLAHNMALNLVQDKKGIVWIGTFNGLTRYDGPNLVVYKDMLDEGGESWANIIDCSAIDHLNRVWVGTRISNGVACYDRNTGKWKKYTSSPETHWHPVAIKEDGKGNIWIGFFDGYVGVITPNDTIIHVLPLGRMPVSNLQVDARGNICAISDNIYRLGIRNGLPVMVRKPVSLFLYSGYEEVMDDNFGRVALSSDIGLHFGIIKNDSFVQLKYIPRALSLQTHILGRSANGNVLFIQQGYAAEYDFEGTLINEFYYTDEMGGIPLMDMVYDVLEDRSGIIWIASSHGVLRLRKNMLDVKRLDTRSQPVALKSSYIRAILVDPLDERVLWLGARQGRLQKATYDRPGGALKKVELIRFGMPVERQTINAIYRTKAGKLLVAGLEGLFVVNEATNQARMVTIKENGKLRSLTELWSITEDNLGNIWAGSHQSGLYIFDKDLHLLEHITTKSRRGLNNNSVWTFLHAKNGETWIGTDSGLYKVNYSGANRKPYFELFRHPVLTASDMWNLLEDDQGRIWVGTTDGGLFCINKDRTEVKSYVREGDNPGKTICSIEVDRHGAIWASTINGVYRISDAASLETVYSEQDGFYSSTFNFKASDTWGPGYIIFGSKSGINFFHPDSVYPRSVPNIYPFVTELSAREGEKWLEPEQGSQVLLSYEQNNIRIKWAFPEYSYVSKHRFRYYLKGFDNDWHYSDGNNPQVSFTNLPPGEYEFELQGSLDGNSWIEPAYSFFIIIEPAFWQTLWFRLTIIVFLALMIIGIVYFRVKGVEHRAEERATFNKRSAELELQALQSQMNPHFLFNAINSIQHFILMKDEIRSSDYLSKFAKLMRSFLEASKVRYITLSEELKQLRLYIELEHLRFEDKFNYRIEVDPALETDLLELPSLLLQPFLENAIGHGLVQRREPGGFLLIAFYKTSEHSLLCVLDDNGIGREKASEIRRMHKPGHKSRGTDLVLDRVKTVNQLRDMFIFINMIDKVREDGRSDGTRIEISISYPEQT